VTAGDGALVQMAHLRFPAHIGVWLAPEARMIHSSGRRRAGADGAFALSAHIGVWLTPSARPNICPRSETYRL